MMLRNALYRLSTFCGLLIFLFATDWNVSAQETIKLVRQVSLASELPFQKPDLGDDYLVQDWVIASEKDSAEISLITVLKKSLIQEASSLPAVLQFTIYVREKDVLSLKEAADRGYVGVIAYSRGKYLSRSAIEPYEHEAKDANTVIAWMAQQAWCNGKIGMYGGSFNGFTQWAATKYLHPALKTIVPYVANRPGMGLPMENNVFINPNYQWVFHVGHNTTLDHAVNEDSQRFRKMQFTWWEQGRAYREIDQIDGTPNPWLQKWLRHPAYDAYWQSMVPYKAEFSKIKIPVLTVDGYFNDSQVSGLNYVRDHYRYLPSAEHYVVVGPYSHFGAQKGGESKVDDLPIDESALFDIKKLTYDWFDYILKGKSKPEFLKDKINYFVLGKNQWMHAPSLDAMHTHHLQFYLGTEKQEGRYHLLDTQPSQEKFLTQWVDFADRENSNNDYYPSPIVKKAIDETNGYIFVSSPLGEPLIMNGAFTGEILARINKQDMDIGITLYELTPQGEYFYLSYVIQRASFAADESQRKLLKPEQKTRIPIANTRMMGKLLQKGSRIVVYLNVNKNPFSQINYGTGKDVSDESLKDAKKKLRVDWFNQSYIKIPVLVHPIYSF